MVRHSKVFQNSFSGFVLYDPARKKTLVDVNGAHYFTPASNVKILTLAACLNMLGDTVPRLRYHYDESSMTEGVFQIFGTGDPTFLHPDFQAWQAPPQFLLDKHEAYRFFRRYRNYGFEPWGDGWAWDDFGEGYSCERSSIPVYGNRLKVTLKDGAVTMEPNGASVVKIRIDSAGSLHRCLLSGALNVPDKRLPDTEFQIPMFDPEKLAIPLIADSFHVRVMDLDPLERENRRQIPLETARDTSFFQFASGLWSVTPIDTVLRKMMVHSDNFIAEQMLLVAAENKFGRLSQDLAIHYMLDSLLSFLPQRPKWVDGSGLSRYNLLSPESVTALLDDLWEKTEHERLLRFFPKGGQEGTVAEYYSGKNGAAYVFAKSGSMSGVQCLSGFIRCNSGKMLIFSFMHNNFVGSGKPWKLEMQGLLEWTRDHY